MAAAKKPGPNFILGVGAQKAGTSWLYNYLDEHPQCAMGPLKEMAFFSDSKFAIHTESSMANRSKKLQQAMQISKRKALPAKAEERLVGILDAVLARYRPERYAEAYERIVRKAPDTLLIGDITPDYTILHPKDVQRMKEHLVRMGYPVKVVMLMRDPVQRCFSAARMRRGEQLRASKVKTAGRGAVDPTNEGFYDFAIGKARVARTRYDQTITALENTFEPDQIFYGIHEDFFCNEEIRRLCAFLGIDFHEPQLQVKRNEGVERAAPPKEQMEQVREFYSETYEFCRNKFGAERIERLWLQ